jgi:RHS repeat-associated protein
VKRILTTRNTGADILQDLNYTYDAKGNITEQVDNVQQTHYFSNAVIDPKGKYEYDAIYRLIKAKGRELAGLNQPSETDCPMVTTIPDTNTTAVQNYTQEYTYDKVGNITLMKSNGNWNRHYFYSGNKLLGTDNTTTQPANQFSYDAHGNMLKMPHLPTMDWDFADNLKQVDLGGGGTAHYVYDGSGNRVRKVIVNGSSKKERFYIGDFEIYRDYTSNVLQTERETVNISDDKKRFLQIETLTTENGTPIVTPTAVFRYQYDNHLGSACLELDSTAQIISYEEYHPFGTSSYRSGKSATEASLKRYRYSGKERDEETGMYYFGARYCAGWLGRFVSTDPKEIQYFTQSTYVLSANNPVGLVDVNGEGVESTHIDANGKVIAVIIDGDNSIYQHQNNADGDTPTEYMINKRQEVYGNMSANGVKIGESLHQYSFVDGAELQKGNVVPVGKIDIGSIWAQNKIQTALNTYGNIFKYGMNAGTKGKYDIKKDAISKEGGIYYGSQITNGIYSSARDAGNFLAGAVSERGIFKNELIAYGFGAYNASGNNAKAVLVTIAIDQAFEMLFGGNGTLQPPTYGEDFQSALGIKHGINYESWFK